jgi:hypothetical protein
MDEAQAQSLARGYVAEEEKQCGIVLVRRSSGIAEADFV